MKEKLSVGFMALSLLAVAATAYVFFTQNSLFGVAGTQWILVAILLGVYSNHAYHCPMLDKGGCCCKPDESKA